MAQWFQLRLSKTYLLVTLLHSLRNISLTLAFHLSDFCVAYPPPSLLSAKVWLRSGWAGNFDKRRLGILDRRVRRVEAGGSFALFFFPPDRVERTIEKRMMGVRVCLPEPSLVSISVVSKLPCIYVPLYPPNQANLAYAVSGHNTLLHTIFSFLYTD